MSEVITADNIFGKQENVAELKLISMQSAASLGEKVNAYLVKWAKMGGLDVDTFQVGNQCPRFSSGDSKGLITESIRGDDLFILVDVGNYSCSYNYFGSENRMSPDDHYQDLKRIIQAAGGKASRISVIMPLLYGGRQHRRTYRESLDCAFMLQELQSMGVKNLVSFDAHDPRVQNAVPLMGFDNVMPSYQVLKALFNNIPNFHPTHDNFMIISPDEGAIGRNMYYASSLGVDLGMFYKRRDYSVIVNGRNPIVAHEYLGNSVEGKDVFIADDIISSGESMLDIAEELKKRHAGNIYCYSTYPIFTNGLDSFDKAYAEGMISGVFGTNLTYQSPELLSREWYHEVDMSKYIAFYIAALNHNISVTQLLDPHKKIQQLLDAHR